MFCYPENIEEQARALFANLAKERHLAGLPAAIFATRAAYYLSELNAIHAFREGNGRTQLMFTAALAENAGHFFDFARLKPGSMLDAMIKSFDGDDEILAAVLLDLIVSKPGSRTKL